MVPVGTPGKGMNEPELKLIRHVKLRRTEMKKYKDGSVVTVMDESFLTTRPHDATGWRGRVEFGLSHKPQLRHVQRSADWQSAA